MKEVGTIIISILVDEESKRKDKYLAEVMHQ